MNEVPAGAPVRPAALPPLLTADPAGALVIDGVGAAALAAEYGTPLFVIVEKAVRAAYRRIRDAFQSRYAGEVVVCAGMKANWGLAVRRIIVGEGGGAEVFGAGELYVALLAGTPAERVIVNGPNKPAELLATAIEVGAMINVDSPAELAAIAAIAAERGRRARVSLRVRLPLRALEGRRFVDPRYGPPGIDIAAWASTFKFGMEPETVLAAIEAARASPHIALCGLMYHGGIPRRAGYFREEAEELMAFVVEASRCHRWQPEHLNIGGGFLAERSGLDAAAMPAIESCAAETAAVIAAVADRSGLPLPRLILEPGRFCVEGGIVWLTRVGTVKDDRTLAHKSWAYVDGSTNDLRDPFDAHGRFHAILVASDLHRAGGGAVDVCGGLCNADDVLAAGRHLPPLRTGDLLAFLDMGAYKESFANQHNVLPRSASVVVADGRAALARRRETIHDVLARESVPFWLLGGQDRLPR